MHFFTLISIVAIAQKPFTGDVTDRDYINRIGFTQIIKTETSDATKGKTVKTTYNFGENGYLTERIVQNTETTTSQFSYDDKGNNIEITTKSSSGKVINSEKYAFDNLNRLSETEIRKTGENIKITERVQWIDENVRHLTRKTNDVETKILTNFDKYNRPISEVLEDATMTEWSYWGNIPVMKKVHNGDVINTIER